MQGSSVDGQWQLVKVSEVVVFGQANDGMRVVTGVKKCALPVDNWKPCGLLREAAKEKTAYEVH